MSSGCGDVLSLEDMKNIKLHQTFEAEVITGREGGVASGGEIDTATNAVTAQVQKTLPAILRDVGFERASFDFTTGGTLGVAYRNKIVYNHVDNNWYSWSGALPHVVSAGTDPTADASWIPRTDEVLREDLANGATGFGADMVAASPYAMVSGVLDRIRTLADIGVSRPVLGYEPANDMLLYNAMAALPDTDLLLNGSINISRPFRGIRRHSSLLALRGGSPYTDDGWNVPIMGVSNEMGLRAYNIYEGVSFYVDAQSPERESWQTVATATYTSTSVTVNASTYAETLAKIKVGDVIRTQHATFCIGIVRAINATTGVITVGSWADSGTTTTTPATATGFYIGYITKAYAQNINTFVTAASDINNAVITEFGASSKKAISGSFNGLDVVCLSQTEQNLTAAFLSRSANREGLGWQYGFRSQGAQFNFHSAVGAGFGRAIRAGFNEASDAIVGLRFNNGNTYSALWSISSDQTDVSLANSPMIIGPEGRNYRRFERLQITTVSVTLTGMHPNIFVTAAGVTLTLPPASVHLVGHDYEFTFVAIGTYVIAPNASDSSIDGLASLTITTTAARKTIKVRFDGSNWQSLYR